MDGMLPESISQLRILRCAAVPQVTLRRVTDEVTALSSDTMIGQSLVGYYLSMIGHRGL